ncbi:YmfL family putative regulatory protein [Celerinatantimonas sp. MCCC 1A17872]|uniref:YmfL family putative regulatory protein n=1 Tax=Celerinatantimonas sp. MCCC 1A17872 TaxID=3177514 RepID=UPI0038C2C2A3
MVDIKDAIRAMCKAYPGGRSAMAGGLGMTVTQFNNNLYEKNGCRFFELDELEAMEDLSGTSLLAEYFAHRQNKLLVDMPDPKELDNLELFRIRLNASADAGQLDITMAKSLEDGQVDSHEEQLLLEQLRKFLTSKANELQAFIRVHRSDTARE